jgi:hypothetical protein
MQELLRREGDREMRLYRGVPGEVEDRERIQAQIVMVLS